MPERSYVGIDSNEHHEWIVVVWTEDKIFLSPPFKNTPTGLAALTGFITERCSKPKICLKPANPAAIKLIKYISSIPNVEVILMSDAGFSLHQTWLQKRKVNAALQEKAGQAFLLAFCAERMI